MLWALVYLVLIVGTLALLVLSALRVWKKVRAVRTEASELSARVSALGADTAALSARLNHAEVLERLAERTG